MRCGACWRKEKGKDRAKINFDHFQNTYAELVGEKEDECGIEQISPRHCLKNITAGKTIIVKENVFTR